MPKRSEFVDYIQEVLGSARPVSARAMFGGFGLYREGLMCALVADDTLYLKTDHHNRGDFEAADSEPFVFEPKDRDPITMSYWRLPESALEDADELAQWMDSAFEAAMRSDLAKPPGKRKLSAKGRDFLDGLAERPAGVAHPDEF